MKDLISNSKPLSELPVAVKALFTGYLVVVGLGLLMSFAQILLTHGMADGKFGLSIDDIVYSYYGTRGNSRLEVKLNGTMKDKASTADRAQIIKWVRNDSPQSGWNAQVKDIVYRNCIKCHGMIPGLADFRTFEGIKKMASFDKGITINALTRVSHIHLFGIAFIFFFIALIFSFTEKINQTLKVLSIAMPFAFLVFDILSWWMTKFIPGFAILTIAAGFGYALSSAFMITTSLYQMWFLKK